ncbi:MAG TPA: DUF5996 family protein [Burkholderiales bacterium]
MHAWQAIPFDEDHAPRSCDAEHARAYSHECSSAGFWPGGDAAPYRFCLSCAYPEPPGFATARVKPAAAHYSRNLGAFVLPYDALRASEDPDNTLLEFLQSTYDAAAGLGGWHRAALELRLPA